MKITLGVGVLFLVLATIFGASAWAAFISSGRQWGVTGITRRRIAIIFGIVGLGLLLLSLRQS